MRYQKTGATFPTQSYKYEFEFNKVNFEKNETDKKIEEFSTMYTAPNSSLPLKVHEVNTDFSTLDHLTSELYGEYNSDVVVRVFNTLNI